MRQLIPILCRGVHYPSAQHCADALGVDRYTVYSALSRGRPDTIGLGNTYLENRGEPFTYRSLTWPSASAASIALGFDRGYVGKATRTGGRPLEVLNQRLAAYLEDQLNE